MNNFGALSRTQQTALIGLGVVEVALLAAAQLDIRRRPAEQIKGTKRTWRLVSLVNLLGPLAYFVFGRRRDLR
ncbi:MAG TPA: PLDc N-terminal domain-containing protein [Propionibacteriaceae bacterium]|jgi:hypothetical protein